MPLNMPRHPFAAVAVALALACAGCGYDPEGDLETRGCLWVSAVARHGEHFGDREVPVCGSIEAPVRDGRLRLSDEEYPQSRVILDLPPAPNAEPGVARVRAVLDAWRPSQRFPRVDARFHGRVEPRRDHENVLHVTRVDWLDGRPPEWR